jgi:hypothetical protein
MPPHDTWLRELSLAKEGLGALLVGGNGDAGGGGASGGGVALDEALLAPLDPAATAADLARTKDVLVQHAGILQVTTNGGGGWAGAWMGRVAVVRSSADWSSNEHSLQITHTNAFGAHCAFSFSRTAGCA